MLGVSAPAAETPPVTLPPFLVEETTQPLPWRHADVAGLEVLSTCPDRLTRELIANHHRLHALLAELVPAELQPRTTQKRLLLFVDSTRQPPTSQEIVARMALTAAEQERFDAATAPVEDGRLRRRAPPPRYTFLPNLRLSDRDAHALFATVSAREYDASRIALTPEYVAQMLRQRLPELPPWYVSGVLTLFGRARFTDDALIVEPVDWPAESASAALRGGAGAYRDPLPFGAFFAGDLAAGAEALPLWQAQAALFVHWGLAGRGAEGRAAFTRFVTRATTEAVTEALFRDCLGLDFTAALKELAGHIPAATRERLVLQPAQRPRLPDYELRPASEVDIARLKGDWERLEIPFVQAQFPALTAKYIEQARRTLRRAYDRGSRDPQLLAVMGLCEVDAGNDAGAREFLEAAASRDPAPRPRAAYELARLRFAALRSGAATSAPLTPAQARTVLAPLASARAQEPPLVEVYTLMADVWSVSAERPTREELAVLEAGVRLFPREAPLVLRTAELNVRQGNVDAARWLINLGLTLAPDDAGRRPFTELQGRMEAVPR